MRGLPACQTPIDRWCILGQMDTEWTETAFYCQSLEETLCHRCGAEATKECDYLMEGEGTWARLMMGRYPLTHEHPSPTCDNLMCDDCSLSIDVDVDYCFDHVLILL